MKPLHIRFNFRFRLFYHQFIQPEPWTSKAENQSEDVSFIWFWKHPCGQPQQNLVQPRFNLPSYACFITSEDWADMTTRSWVSPQIFILAFFLSWLQFFFINLLFVFLTSSFNSLNFKLWSTICISVYVSWSLCDPPTRFLGFLRGFLGFER